ncbi:MAG TPA: sulfotransferase [Roseiarcus sp.]|nr:sulfotransferase [Roseiarcus sp.]
MLIEHLEQAAGAERLSSTSTTYAASPAAILRPHVVDEPCPCGSGLRHKRCCGLDWAATWPGETPDLGPVRTVLAAGKRSEAEQRLVALLESSPRDGGALALLYELRLAEDKPAAAEALLARIVRLDPNNLAATQTLALMLFNKGALVEAEYHARNAVRIAPTDAQSHNLMGMIMTEAHRPHVGEHHYRAAMRLMAKPSPILTANLAWNLRNQGRMGESRAFYEESVRLDPTIFQTHYGWARMEESDRNFARAAEELNKADKLSPGNPSVLLQRAILYGRVGDYDNAMGALNEIERRREGGGLGPVEWSERGLLLDRMGRHSEAFAAFVEGKRSLRALTGQSYRAREVEELARRLTDFFRAPRLKILPRAGIRFDVPQPIFIVGFPRSGTTLIEQTLSAHPLISAGDELPIIGELTGLIPRLLNSPLAYPEALSELWLGDQVEGLDNLRDHYLQRARQLGALRKKARWFTDKMPLNETHLGLINLVFPNSPIIHIVRHPLDVVLSVFSNHLTHGFYCAYDLVSIARHYSLIAELVEHYLREMSPKYLPVRYEDVIDRQEETVRKIFAFIGAPFDRRCLDFHENRRYARTASYAQVTEKLYDRSRGRWRAYRDELQPVIPILEPICRRLGYECTG